MRYLATFYTHFAAMTFYRGLASRGLEGRMMPVPRRLSASCGTCVSFESGGDFAPLLVEDTEEVFRVEENDFVCVYKHQEC
jgi:hypothetical protein